LPAVSVCLAGVLLLTSNKAPSIHVHLGSTIQLQMNDNLNSNAAKDSEVQGIDLTVLASPLTIMSKLRQPILQLWMNPGLLNY
jgi:hypothetical protein